MYPFRILLVKTDDGIYMRVVYQQYRNVQDTRISTRNILISSAALPEWDIRSNERVIYLRGYAVHKDHIPRRIVCEEPTDELIEKINNDLKLIYQPTN